MRSVTLYFPFAREIPVGRALFASDQLHLPLDDGARPFVEGWPTLRLPCPLGRLTEETGLEETSTDAYGDPLTFTLAGEVPRPPEPEFWSYHPRTRAVITFLRWLPREQMIVLDWD